LTSAVPLTCTLRCGSQPVDSLVAITAVVGVAVGGTVCALAVGSMTSINMTTKRMLMNMDMYFMDVSC
jgi:hypothetical protein